MRMCGRPTVPVIRHSVSARYSQGVPSQSRLVTSSGGVMPSCWALERHDAFERGVVNGSTYELVIPCCCSRTVICCRAWPYISSEIGMRSEEHTSELQS